MYVLALDTCLCTDRDRDLLLMYKLADFPEKDTNSTSNT